MRFLTWRKDGGPESSVSGFFLVEIKSLFSIVLLRFVGASRPAFHTHAFNTVSWLLRGRLGDTIFGGPRREYRPSWRPVWTPRERFHKVDALGVGWVISFRGPWRNWWREYRLGQGHVFMTHGRRELGAGVGPVPESRAA
jgi:hypothetical protein